MIKILKTVMACSLAVFLGVVSACADDDFDAIFGDDSGSTSASSSKSNSKPKPVKKNIALLAGTSSRQALAEWSYYSIEAVDGQPVSHFFQGAEKEVELKPGVRYVVITGGFNRGWGGPCPCLAHIALAAKLKPGKRYVAKGEVSGHKVIAWIEEVGTKKIVSDKVSQPYYAKQQRTPTYIYIR